MLSRRDELLLAGWDFQKNEDIPARLGALAEIETIFHHEENPETAILLVPGYADRLVAGLKKLDEMVQKNPSNPSAFAVRGSIYESQGNIEEAKKSYAQALQIDPNSEVAANNLAYLVAENGGDLQSALGWAQAARKKQPQNPGIADTLGWIYYKLGNHVLARDQLQYAVSIEPGNGVFQYHLGMIYKANKQLSDAERAFRKAINIPKEFKEKNLAQAALKEIAK